MISRERLAAMIDHTLLQPVAGQSALKKLCAEAREHGMGHVCVNPRHVARAAELLRGSGVGVCSVIGFPLGANLHEAKAIEARRVVELGADEVDMVLDISALKDGEDFWVQEDIEGVVKAASVPVKVILETCYLSDEEKKRACELAMGAGASFVKTSTGFGPSGATVEDVRLMKGVVGNKMGVKAAGGIRSFDAALAMIRAGASRIGTSAGPAILDGWRPEPIHQ